MENEIKDDILDVTEDTTVEEPVEDSEEKVEQYTENEKRQYARAKKAEAKNKELLEELKKFKDVKIDPTKKEEIKTEIKETNPLDTVKLVNALRDLDDVEVEQAQMIADYKKISLVEAVKDEGFKLFFNAKREKDKQDNLLQKPNGKQGGVDKKDPFFEKFSQNMPRGFEIK